MRFLSTQTITNLPPAKCYPHLIDAFTGTVLECGFYDGLVLSLRALRNRIPVMGTDDQPGKAVRHYRELPAGDKVT
jgi:hypothetical protein